MIDFLSSDKTYTNLAFISGDHNDYNVADRDSRPEETSTTKSLVTSYDKEGYNKDLDELSSRFASLYIANGTVGMMREWVNAGFPVSSQKIAEVKLKMMRHNDSFPWNYPFHFFVRMHGVSTR